MKVPCATGLPSADECALIQLLSASGSGATGAGNVNAYYVAIPQPVPIGKHWVVLNAFGIKADPIAQADISVIDGLYIFPQTSLQGSSGTILAGAADPSDFQRKIISLGGVLLPTEFVNQNSNMNSQTMNIPWCIIPSGFVLAYVYVPQAGAGVCQGYMGITYFQRDNPKCS